MYPHSCMYVHTYVEAVRSIECRWSKGKGTQLDTEDAGSSPAGCSSFPAYKISFKRKLLIYLILMYTYMHTYTHMYVCMHI